MDKKMSFGMALIYMVLMLAAQLILGIVLGLAIGLGMVTGALDPTENMMTLVTRITPYISAVSSLLGVLAIALILKLRKKALKQAFKIKPISLREGLTALVAGLGMTLFINGLLEILNSLMTLPGVDALEELLDFKNTGYLLSFLFIGLLIPIFEELILRGAVLSELEDGFSWQVAVVIQALFFGIIHMNITQSTYAFVLGIMIGVFVYWSQSIITGVIMHVVLNTAAVFTSYLADQRPALFTMELNYVMVLLGLFILGGTFLYGKKLHIFESQV